MRKITPILSPEIERAVNGHPIDRARPIPVYRYKDLVKKVASLAYLNKDHLLFFRGQDRDYLNKADASTIYPTIYRGDYVSRKEIEDRFRTLARASEVLNELVSRQGLKGRRELSRRPYIQWSILQHYGVCATPLLDLTHSLAAACSFAQIGAKGRKGVVLVFGIPYITHRVSRDSEHETIVIRLLSICPPDALRPYFQDGYLAGTDDIRSNYHHKSELDFKRRLISKFQISVSDNFWGEGFSRIPRTLLFPEKDRMQRLCERVKESVER